MSNNKAGKRTLTLFKTEGECSGKDKFEREIPTVLKMLGCGEVHWVAQFTVSRKAEATQQEAGKLRWEEDKQRDCIQRETDTTVHA